jgi:hypothetical protein
MIELPPMKGSPALALLFSGLLAAAPQESPAPSLAIDDIDFKLIRRQVETIDAEEPAPLPGMIPVRRKITITVDEVEAPHLPKPPPPPAATGPDPEALAAFRARMALRPKPLLIHLSATVYDHENTLLRGFPNGRPDQEMIAWSNIDWSLLAGQSRFTIAGREYHILLGLGRESTENRRRLAARLGRPYNPPVLPELPPDETPAFVVTEN